MKQNLLLVSFLLVAALCWGQSFGDRLAVRPVNTEKPEMQVFPNPATTYISITDNDAVFEIAVYNLVGKKTKSFRYNKGDQYYIGDLPRGMYLVQMTDRSNRTLVTHRVRAI